MSTIKKYFIYSLFLANLAIIIGFWWSLSQTLFTNTADILLALGRICGLLAVYFILLQFLLMGRTIWLEKLFGLDKLARIHKLNGYLTISFIILHPIFITFSYALSAQVNFFAQFLDFLKNYDDVLSAAIAVVLFIAVVFLSISMVRKGLKYELWYFVHLLTYLAVILAFGHQLKLGGDFLSNQTFSDYWYALYIFVFGNVLLFRFIKPIYTSLKYKFYVSDVIAETPDTTSIYISGKNLEKFKTKPGQFIVLQFLCKGFWWEGHPFSLSFMPKNNQLRVTIKSCGDFTSRVQALKKGTPIYLNGPYGVFTAKPETKTKYLFIAGGVGITPLRSLIEQLAPTNDVVLIYSNRMAKDIIFKNELDDLAQKYHCTIHYVLTEEKDYQGEKGRVDKEKLERLIKDIREREVYICGPAPMIDAMRNLVQSKEIGVKPQYIHFEKFAL